MKNPVNIKENQPTRVDCLITEQLLCTRLVNYQLTFNLPSFCSPFPLAAGAFASAELLNVNCRLIMTSQNPVIFLVQLETLLDITVSDSDGQFLCSFPDAGTGTSSVFLGSCPDTGIDCHLFSHRILALELVNGSPPYVLVTLEVCFSLVREIHLLVPTIGYCIPRACSIESENCPPANPV